MLNEILGPMARLQQRLTRAFSITGGAPSPQITPEITPVLEMGNMPVEDRWTARERLWAHTQPIAAAALTAASILLQNPAGSGILAVVRCLVCNNSAGPQAYSVNDVLASFGNLTNVVGVFNPLDTRIGVASTPTCIISWSNTVAPANTFGSEYFNLAVGQFPYVSPFDYVIAPGTGLVVNAQVVNQSSQLGFVWRERPVSLGELQL